MHRADGLPSLDQTLHDLDAFDDTDAESLHAVLVAAGLTCPS